MSSDERSVELAAGRSIPIIGFGTWQIQGETCYESVLRALQIGYRHIDTATGYENEVEVGRAVHDSGLPRQEIFITTKLPPDRAGRERQTIDASLRALGCEYVDLWLIHWPPRDSRTSVAVWSEFIALRDQGKALAIGVSNYDQGGIDELVERTGEVPALNQIRWSPFLYEASVEAYCRDRGVVLEGYSPFKESQMNHPVLVDIARSHSVQPAQIILRWHIEHGVVVIPKSEKPERIASNFDVFGFSLGADEVASIDALSRLR